MAWVAKFGREGSPAWFQVVFAVELDARDSRLVMGENVLGRSGNVVERVCELLELLDGVELVNWRVCCYDCRLGQVTSVGKDNEKKLNSNSNGELQRARMSTCRSTSV